MIRVALNARYSADNQSAASIADQFQICREHAARESWNVVATYCDVAISGASVVLRPGVQSLLQDANRENRASCNQGAQPNILCAHAEAGRFLSAISPRNGSDDFPVAISF
jgi:hypothetical protein